MDVLGVLLIFILPYVVGYVFREITVQKETNQIETYLIGFFLLFLIQGVVFGMAVFTGMEFQTACKIMRCVELILSVIFLVIAGIRVIPAGRKLKKAEAWKKEERILFGVMVFVFCLVVARIFFETGGGRSDAMLETVKTTLATDTMFQYHPLTGHRMEMGMIASKKIVTLPLYYAYLSSLTGIAPSVLLYDVLAVQTLIAVYFAATLVASKIWMKLKRKVFLLQILLGMLILSGDYFKDTASYRLLFNGYAGNTICMTVMIPYLLYLVYSWFHTEIREKGATLFQRITYVGKIALCFAASLFMTGIATGFLFLFLTLVLAGISCLAVTLLEVRQCRE